VAQIRFTVRARRDLIDIWLELGEADPTAADELYNRLEACVEILRRFRESRQARDSARGSRLVKLVFAFYARSGIMRNVVNAQTGRLDRQHQR
jgi:plasmid stabilization system protein ParE